MTQEVKAKIQLTGIIEVSYNPNSKEFHEALEDYKKIIDKEGDVEGMLQHIAYNINQFGPHSMIEGVGYIRVQGMESTYHNEPFSGVYIEPTYDDFDTETINP